MRGGGHNNFHRGILKVPVKLFSRDFSSWINGSGVLCLGTLVDLGPFFLDRMIIRGLFLTFLLQRIVGALLEWCAGLTFLCLASRF